MAVHELFAYLCVRNSGEAIEFYRRAFGAKEKFRLTEPSGRIGHAELDFGGTTLRLCDEFPDYGIRAPQPGQNTSVTIHIHVDNADAAIEQAVAAGATVETAPADAFYGERSGWDGHEEVARAGALWHTPPGRTAWCNEDSEFIEFSPQQELVSLLDHVPKQVQASR
jgi:PhnB protein